jgi:aspartate carbamoyltransferase catalytic subunit
LKPSKPHLLGLESMPAQRIKLILDTAESFKEVLERPIRVVPTLRGVSVANLFFEPSTRTRLSFELAEKRLSAELVNLSAATSSVLKGETLKDTARNIEAMKVDMVVIRHSSSGAASFLARSLQSSVINAGDGAHEHPTQALLDLLTLKERFGELKGLRVVIIGDIAYSRVARSNIWGLKTMGASVAVCGPPTLIPLRVEEMGVKVYHDLDQALQGTEVIYVLRLQLERQKRGLLPSLREYTNQWGITADRLAKLKQEFIIMHPGPINRGVEITPEVADGPYSLILDQVTNGVAVRMAVLYLISGGKLEG